MKHGVGRAALGALLLAAVLLSGCVEDALEACDIAELECQESVHYAVTRLRGDGFDPFAGVPPIDTLSREQYRARLESARAAADAAMDAEPEVPRFDAWGRALQLLSLITPETAPAQASIDDQVDNVAAFYSSGTGRVTVIDQHGDQNSPGHTLLLFHELVHAFQDRDNSLRGSGGDTDRGFARRALVEGEATLYELLARAELQGEAYDPREIEETLGAWTARRRERMPEQSSPYFTASRWFVYPLGGTLVARHYQRGGNAAVRALWLEPPVSSLELLRGGLGQLVSATEPLDCEIEAPELPELPDVPESEYRRHGVDRFGAIQLYALLVAQGAGESAAWARAQAWRDDRIYVYADPQRQSVALSWRIRFDAVVGALQAQELLSAQGTLRITRIERDLQIDATDQAGLLDAWAGASCP